jgi:hypothetical protein
MVSNQSDRMVSSSMSLKVSIHITFTIWASIDEDVAEWSQRNALMVVQ